MINTLLLSSMLACSPECDICQTIDRLEDTECMSGSERKKIFYEIQQLKSQAMNHISEAYNLRWKFPNVDAQHLYDAIIADAWNAIVSKNASATNICIACLQQLKNAVCEKCDDWYYGQTLITAAKLKFQMAEKLEAKLWMDDDPHDWM